MCVRLSIAIVRIFIKQWRSQGKNKHIFNKAYSNTGDFGIGECIFVP